jgi:hypothetical protein
MSEVLVTHRLREVLLEHELPADAIEQFAGSLLWRIGRLTDEDPVTVRVGFATSASAFADLPRLRNASDEELVAAVENNHLRVEWVGPRTRSTP